MRWALIGLVMVAGCTNPMGPEIPEGAVPMEPRPVYADWWEHVMRQVDIRRDVSRVRWYLVNAGPWESDRYGGATHGAWVSDGRIYIADGFLDCENLVKHEMAHEILRGDRDHTHPIFETYSLAGTCQ